MASIRCAHCRDTHTSVADVYACFAQQQWEAEVYRQESASERYFEDRGFDAAREQEQREWERGVVGFQEAWADWNRANGINDGVHGDPENRTGAAYFSDEGYDGCAEAERINEERMMFGPAYAQMTSYEDYMEREREIYYGH